MNQRKATLRAHSHRAEEAGFRPSGSISEGRWAHSQHPSQALESSCGTYMERGTVKSSSKVEPISVVRGGHSWTHLGSRDKL